ncbi:hypothetical protein NHX12_002638 [Muraenolepis orangiensis]|uniref:Uncharacterized protein n=1 Tax=Muraenolepis orangiensis TaxID=630683 RepID=A0A9Q0IEX2_9TELE|nr:hypothetical protein NHX12_002638 [Muraenolepis orangiensis]
MLVLEPRALDDDTPESEASIGTADSSENITMETEGATSDLQGRETLPRRKLEAKSRRTQRRQPDSSPSSSSSSPATAASSSFPSSFHRPSSLSTSSPSSLPFPHRFRSSSSGPLLTSCPPGGAVGQRGSEVRLRLSHSSPRDPADGRRRETGDCGSTPRQLVLYGSNEFMV